MTRRQPRPALPIKLEVVAKRLGVSDDTLRAWIKTGKLRAHKAPGGKRGMWIYAEDVREFLVPVEPRGW